MHGEVLLKVVCPQKKRLYSHILCNMFVLREVMEAAEEKREDEVRMMPKGIMREEWNADTLVAAGQVVIKGHLDGTDCN